MQGHSLPIHAYMDALVFLPVHTWVCIVQAHSLPSCTYMGTVASTSVCVAGLSTHRVQSLHWTLRLEGSMSSVDGVAEVRDAGCAEEKSSAVSVCT